MVNDILFILAGIFIGYLLCVNKRIIMDRFIPDDPVLSQVKSLCSTVFKDMQHIPIKKAKETYTIDKERVYMCTTDKQDQVFPLNTLIYVLLHEYAHIKTTSIGHTEEFHQVFDEILDIAIKHGLYNEEEGVDEKYSVDGNCGDQSSHS